MTGDYYRVDMPTEEPPRHRKLRWFIFIVVVLLVILGVYLFIRSLKPHTVIKDGKEVQTNVTYEAKTKHYDEPDFGIDLPLAFAPTPLPGSPYNAYLWQSSDHSTNGLQIEVFEDTIPANYAVNRVLIVQGAGNGHVTQLGAASDNCIKYTIGSSRVGSYGTPARWQGVDFICDAGTVQRDVIGTSSTDGVNIVKLQSPTTGKTHQFLFTMTNANYANPDYSSFYSAIESFKLK